MAKSEEVKASRKIGKKSETRTFSRTAWDLMGSDPDHNGGWSAAAAETPAEATGTGKGGKAKDGGTGDETPAGGTGTGTTGTGTGGATTA